MRPAAPLAVALALAAAAPAGAAPRQATINLSGQPVTGALIADLAYFYSHAVKNPSRFSIVGGSTVSAIADTTRGIVDGGMVSRNLIAGDPSGLVFTPVALSGICLVTNRSNPVPDITRAQIQDIVATRVTSWTQVPGSTRTDAIVPVGIDPSAGAFVVFQNVFIDIATPVLWAPRTFATAAQVRTFVESTPGAFGYVDLALAGQVHKLTYEGVPCTRETIRTATYPAQRPLGVVTRGKPRGALKRFLRWVATSRKARQVIATRYIPWNR